MSPPARLAAVASHLLSSAPRVIQAPAEPLLDLRCELGESPVYEQETNTLHWVDIGKNQVHHLQLHTHAHTFDTYEHPVSCIRLRTDGPGFIAACLKGFAILPPSTSLNPAPISYLALASSSSATTPQMFNDGEVDPAGRFIAATKILRGLPVKLLKESTMFSVDKSGKVETVLEGLALPNGIGFTKDSKTIYVTDTLLSTIFSFSYDLPTGTIDLSSRKIFVNTKAEANGGLPDGLAVDAADHVWCAKFRGSRVTRYRPDGSIDLEILFDKAQNITCIEFGGRGKDFLTTLFVTTSSLAESGQGGKQALLDKYTLSGAVFAVDLKEYGIQGRAKYRFAG